MVSKQEREKSMIYLAKFRTHRNFSDMSTYVSGTDEVSATNNIHKRHGAITALELSQVPIVTVGDAHVNDYIYMIENGQTIGHERPRESAYKIMEHNEAVCSGEYANHITCRNSSGVLVPIAPDRECIVAIIPA
jgi:hypothetical protein